MLGFIIFVFAILFFCLLGLGIVVLVWRYEINKETKAYDYGIVSNHRNVCIIGIQNIKNLWFGCKIEGNIKGEIPLFGNIIYYNEGVKHIPVLVYYAKQDREKICLMVYGIKAKQISKSGLFTNRRNSYQIRKVSTDLKEIQYPLIIKPSILLLFSLVWSLFITCLLLGIGLSTLIGQSGLIGPIICLILGGFMLYADYQYILSFKNNRGRLTENGHLYVGKNRYRIKELQYETNRNAEGHLNIILKDHNKKIILALDDHYSFFYQFYAYMEDMKIQLSKQNLYHLLFTKEFYMPLTENGYIGIKADDGFHMLLFENIKELESMEYENLAGDQLITLKEAVDISQNFESVSSIVIRLDNPDRQIEVTRQMWDEIKENQNII